MRPPGACQRRSGKPVAIAGDPAKSPLWERIFATDPDDLMTPPDSLKELSGAPHPAAITTDAPSRSGWPAAESRAARPTGRPTIIAGALPRIRFTSAI
ncbi:MAG: c-type cytochrome domain-containing protein [Roseibacillus sp.]